MDELVKNILIKLENVGKIARITYFLLFLGSSIALFILAFTYLASKEAFAVALIGNASFVAGMTFIVWLLMVAERGKEIADNDRVSQIIDELQSSMPKQEGIFIAKK